MYLLNNHCQKKFRRRNFQANKGGDKKEKVKIKQHMPVTYLKGFTINRKY